MPSVDLVVFHRPAAADDPPLTALLQEARGYVASYQAGLFRQEGIGRVLFVEGTRADGRGSAGTRNSPGVSGAGAPAGSFGEALRELLRREGVERLIVLGSGAVPRLRRPDASLLVAAAGSAGRRALTNNRFSSDVCAVSDAAALGDLPALPADNALPRWLEERAGFVVEELPARERLSLDLDSPLDLGLLALAPGLPAPLRALDATGGRRSGEEPEDGVPRSSPGIAGPSRARIAVPRLAELRSVAADPRRELLVFGRTSSRTLGWLERNVRCRVRVLAEERGLRASSRLALALDATNDALRPARATLGRLLEGVGPAALVAIVGELADAALIDTRVLLADRLGVDESRWPAAEDRYASDLLRYEEVSDPWLRELTRAAAGASFPIVLGGHSLVGPGVRLVLAAADRDRRARPPAIE
jgi:hypothetical protein